MTPAELKALADAATPYYVNKGRGIFATGTIDAYNTLTSLAPDLARLCAEMGEALEEIAKERFGVMPDGSTPSSFASAALSKFADLEPR